MKILFSRFPAHMLLSLTIIFGCGGVNTSPDADHNSSLPNIVIIFTDDQGYEDLGCFGSPDIRTPHIDGMAREGIRLTNFYVAHPICSASRAALLTGCYANRLGIHGAYSPYVGKGLHPDEETIAEVLRPLGYATAIYGKWHLGSEPEFLPTRQGFDEYFGIPYSNDMWPNHPWQGTVFDFPELPLVKNETVVDTLEDQSMITTQYTQHAVSFIKKNKDKPFFLYVPHSMPHVPLFVSNKFRGKSARGLYGDVIQEIDWSVGQILMTLRSEGIEENTLVIFTSDNGPWLSYGTHSGEAHPLKEGKATAWEGGVRVPCVMKWPGHISPDVETSKPAMTIDILPTICEITGAQLPAKKIDGKSMLSLLTAPQSHEPHHDIYYFYHGQNELQAIMTGDGKWKMCYPHRYRTLGGRVGTDDGLPIDYDYVDLPEKRLYDLELDVGESKNVLADNPNVGEMLDEKAEVARATLGDKLTNRVGSENRAVGKIEAKK